MSFQRNLLLACALLTGVAAGTPVAPTGSRTVDERPNVLFVLIDDLNDWVGCLGGHPDALTPNIDRLAEAGTLFTNAHCNAPLCNPSRASLFSGVHPDTSGVYDNVLNLRSEMPDVVMLPELFRTNGYEVLGCGKTFHGSLPEPASWDAYYPEQDYLPKGPLPERVPSNGLSSVLDWAELDVEDEEMVDHGIASWAIDRLRRPRAADAPPFFLTVGFQRPHLPFYAPKAYHERFRDDPPALPENASGQKHRGARSQMHAVISRRQGAWEGAVSSYLACSTFVDVQIGRVLDALAASDHAEDTLVVLASDHGLHLGEKRHWKKKSLWEEATRIPLVFAGPGIPAGSRVGAPVGLIDLFPTIVELCGLEPPPDQLDGHSLAPLLADPGAPWPHVVITSLGPEGRAVRDARYRFIRNARSTDELYDHATDPHEWVDLSRDPDHEEILEALAARLEKR